MTVSEALLNCISAALDGRECAPLTLAPDDWTALLRLAGEQKLLPLVYAAVRGTPGFAAAPEAVRSRAPADHAGGGGADRAHGGIFAALSGAARRGTCAGRRQGHRLPRSVSAAGAAPLKR